MPTHTIHDDILEGGLDLDCPRCRELAGDPLHLLDAENIVRIRRGHLYSDLDREAAARLDRVVRDYRTLLERAP